MAVITFDNIADFEANNTYYIRNLITSIGKLIESIYGGNLKTKQYYRIGLDWIMYLTSLRIESSLYPLENVVLDFDYVKMDLQYHFGSQPQKFEQVKTRMTNLFNETKDILADYTPLSTNAYRTKKGIAIKKAEIQVSQGSIDYMLGKITNLTKTNQLNLVYAVLSRYETYGSSKSSMCLSADEIYTNVNTKTTLEMFANPVNAHTEHYCSPFSELESYFGSIGSALKVPTEVLMKYEAIVANPPYVNAIMEHMADRLVILKELGYTGSITIVMPDWRSDNMEYPAYNILYEHITNMEVKSGDYCYVDYFTRKKLDAVSRGTLVITL